MTRLELKAFMGFNKCHSDGLFNMTVFGVTQDVLL